MYAMYDTAKPLSVTELCDLINEALAELGEVTVEGEVRGFKGYPSGHRFFNLTDGKANISVALFSSVHPEIGHLDDGTRITVAGRVDYYKPYGRLSFIARQLTIGGEGELWRRIEEVKKRLQEEGLFDESRKRPLPLLPRKVGVICGHEAAVKRDILATAEHRFPGYPIEFAEVTVQGDGAVEAIIAAMARLANTPDIDVIVLARGGGSLSELAPFYDEKLCRAIAACPVPVVSAIGHEKDQPLTDLVADRRASTPTRAAVEVIPSAADLRETLQHAMASLDREIDDILFRASLRAGHLDPTPVFGTEILQIAERRVLHAKAALAENAPAVRIERLLARLAKLHPSAPLESRFEELGHRLGSLDPTGVFHERVEAALLAVSDKKNGLESFADRLERSRIELEKAAAELSALGPSATLARGYSVVRTQDGRIVRASEDAPRGTLLEITTASDKLLAESKGPAEETL
jgi:exodeoxyribonuclease VII large subunit